MSCHSLKWRVALAPSPLNSGLLEFAVHAAERITPIPKSVIKVISLDRIVQSLAQCGHLAEQHGVHPRTLTMVSTYF